MRTGAINLQSVARPDFDLLMRWIDSRSTLCKWAGGRFVFPLDEAQLERYLARTAEPRRFRFMSYAGEPDPAPLGYFEVAEFDVAVDSAYFWLVLLAPEFRGRGFGAAMLDAALAKCFDELRLHRVGVRVFDSNEAALACYEKVGFVREGVLREAGRYGRDRRDLVVLSVLEDEWRGRRRLPGVPVEQTA